MDLKELQERQGWPLQKKIDHALFTIETFISRTNGQCYVAFSGGKDSSCLLDLVRIIDKTIPAVFVNTGKETWRSAMSIIRDARGQDVFHVALVVMQPMMRDSGFCSNSIPSIMRW